MFSILCLLASAAILFYVLKFRVHIHVHISSENSGIRQSVRPARPAKVSPVRRRNGTADSGIRALGDPAKRDSGNQTGTPENESQQAQAATIDLESALRNLGAKPATARIAATKAASESQDFNQALKLAIQYATKEAA